MQPSLLTAVVSGSSLVQRSYAAPWTLFSGIRYNEGSYLPQNEPLQRQQMDATAAQRCDVFSRSVLGCLPRMLRALHIALPRSALEGPLHALTTTFDFAEPIAGMQASTALGLGGTSALLVASITATLSGCGKPMLFLGIQIKECTAGCAERPDGAERVCCCAQAQHWEVALVVLVKALSFSRIPELQVHL